MTDRTFPEDLNWFDNIVIAIYGDIKHKNDLLNELESWCKKNRFDFSNRQIANWARSGPPQSRGASICLQFLEYKSNRARIADSSSFNRMRSLLANRSGSAISSNFKGAFHIMREAERHFDDSIKERIDFYKGYYIVVRKSRRVNGNDFYQHEVIRIADTANITEMVNYNHLLFRGFSVFAPGIINVVLYAPHNQRRFGLRMIQVLLPADIPPHGHNRHDDIHPGILLRLNDRGAVPVADAVILRPILKQEEICFLDEVFDGCESLTKLGKKYEKDIIQFVRHITREDDLSELFQRYETLMLGTVQTTYRMEDTWHNYKSSPKQP